jgi:predicted secreted protein
VRPAMSNERIQVQPGDTFEIALREPGATGHRWRLTDRPEEIALLDEQYEAPAPDGPIGSPGRRVMTLRAPAEGHYSLRFELRRPWETRSADEHVVDLDVM